MHLLHPARGPLRGAGKASRTAGRIDYIIVESSGISEPLPVAETFTFKDETGTSLGDVARLDTLVTVVDGASFLDELYAADALKTRGWEVAAQDERTVAQLFCDQLEFANVIIMNKMDLMDDEGRARLRAILRRFNPGAELVEATWGRVDPKRILGTGLFDLAKAEQHPDWLKEARVGEHTPESVEYGISSFTFNSRRPFNVARFEKLTDAMEAHAEIAGMPRRDAALAGEEEVKVNSEDAGVQAARQVIRAKGLVWLANRRSHWQQGMGSLAGRSFTIAFAAPWAAAVDSAGPRRNEAGEASPEWKAPWGDRRTELVVIGQNMDHGAMRAALEACVVNEEEMQAYTESFSDAYRFLHRMSGGCLGTTAIWRSASSGTTSRYWRRRGKRHKF